jgi:hypothetical protein
VAVDAHNGEQIVDRGEDGGGSWRCNGGKGGVKVGVDNTLSPVEGERVGEGGGAGWGPGRGQPERRSSPDECWLAINIVIAEMCCA